MAPIFTRVVNYYTLWSRVPQEGETYLNMFSPNTYLLVSRLAAEKMVEIHS